MTFFTAEPALVVGLRPLGLFGLSCDLDSDSLIVDVFAVHFLYGFVYGFV